MTRTLIAAVAATLLMTSAASAYQRGYPTWHGRHYGHHHHHHGHGWACFALGAVIGGALAANAYRARAYRIECAYVPPLPPHLA